MKSTRLRHGPRILAEKLEEFTQETNWTPERVFAKANEPMWMTKGRTVLLQKDKEKGIKPSNDRSITCLPLVWKILTSVIAEEIYYFLDASLILAEEQKGCRKRSRGTGDLLYIDRIILREAKQRKRSLVMGWINYRKAFDMIPHSWILNCLKMMGINKKIQILLDNNMKS